MISILAMICLSPVGSPEERCFSYSAPNMVQTVEACEAMQVPTMYQLIELISSRNNGDFEITRVEAACLGWTQS